MSKAVYLVLDMENDLIHPDGAGGKGPIAEQARSRGIIEKTAAAIRKARAAGALVGYVRVAFSPEYVECPRNSPVFGGIAKAGMLKLGTWGSEVHEALAPQPGDLIVIKHRVSPFYSTTLEAQLRAQGVTRIYCSGVSTQAVVQATVRDGHDRDYEMFVLEDCSAAHSAEEHANSIGSLKRFCTVTTSSEATFT